MKTHLRLIIFFFLAIAPLAAQQPELLKDINAGTGSSYIIYMTTLGGKAVFKATNTGTNNELWVTDGTADGTFMLREINPSPSAGSSVTQITVYNSEAYFSADDGEHGAELWKTDGTSAGTVMVADIAPGETGSKPGDLTVFKGELYFRAYHPDTGTELWKSDGTAAGTKLVKNLAEGAASVQPGYLFPTSTCLYFIGLGNNNLYVSNGTAEGTGLVSDQVDIGILEEAFFTEYNNEVYFRGTDISGNPDGKGTQLWKVTGTGVCRVTDIVSGGNTTVLDPRHLTVAAGKLFFVGEESPNGRELWVYDGTARMVKDINPSGHGNLGGFFASFDGKLIFSAGDATTGIEPWVSDGTADGTKMITDLWAGTMSSSMVSPVIIGDTLYFSANEATGGEIWRLTDADGQPEKFTNIDDGGAYGPELARVGHTFVFQAGNAATGTELWKMDLSGGTAVNTLENKAPSVNVYPNPITGEYFLVLPDNMPLPAKMTVWDITGKPVVSTTISERQASFMKGELPLKPGVYFIKLESGKVRITRRIIVAGI